MVYSPRPDLGGLRREYIVGPPYPNALRKRRLKWGGFRNNRKKASPVSALETERR